MRSQIPLLLLLSVVAICSCYTKQKQNSQQTIQGLVLTEPERTVYGYTFKIVTERQHWTDTVQVKMGTKGRYYKKGYIYPFSVD